MSEHFLQNVLLFFFFFLVVIQKAIHLLRESYRNRRGLIYQKPLMSYLCGDASTFGRLKTTRPIDREILALALMESAENFAGEFGPRVRTACEQLGFVQDHVRRIQSRRWWVRAQAAYRLGLMGSPQAESFLIAALDDPIAEVRLMAIRSLAALDGQLALKPIIEHFKENSGWGLLEISDIVLRLGPVCLPILLETLNGDALRARLVAIDLLGLLKDSRAVAPLILTLNSPRQEVRIRAVKALGLIADAAAIPAICRCAGDPSWEVRLMVGSAIGRAGGLPQIPVLVHLLNDAEKRVRVEAAEALIQLGEFGRAALRQAGLGPDAFTHYLAGQFLPPTAEPPVARLA